MSDSIELPIQPSRLGHALVLVLVPLPQVVEQAPHSDHGSNSQGGLSEQLSDSVELPIQPSRLGHVLVLVLVPLPQVLEQPPHSDHGSNSDGILLSGH